MGAPAGVRQQRGQVRSLEAAQRRGPKGVLDADRDGPQPAGEVRAGVGEQAGLRRTESYCHLGRQDRAVRLAGIRVDAAGDVAGHHQPWAGTAQRVDQCCRRTAQST